MEPFSWLVTRMLIIKKILRPAKAIYKHLVILISISIMNNQEETVRRLLILLAQAFLK